jgi:hypothetical protein
VRVLTIMVRHGTEKYADAEEQLDALMGRLFPDVDRIRLVVDNALPRDTVEHSDKRTLLGGDNAAWEFSAFDRAVEWLGATVKDYDYIHFATSAFNELYTGYLERFNANVLRAASGRSVGIGHIDCYNEPVRICSYVSQHWIRTAFFFLPPAMVQALGSFVSVADSGIFFGGSAADPFKTAAPLSETYRRNVVGWLCGEDIGQGVQWHSRLTLSAEALPMFERKAAAIFNEHLLSIRLRSLGCRLVDVTWLSTVLLRSPIEQISWKLPWKEQLAARDRDRVVVAT